MTPSGVSSTTMSASVGFVVVPWVWILPREKARLLKWCGLSEVWGDNLHERRVGRCRAKRRYRGMHRHVERGRLHGYEWWWCMKRWVCRSSALKRWWCALDSPVGWAWAWSSHSSWVTEPKYDPHFAWAEKALVPVRNNSFNSLLTVLELL